MFRRDIRKQFPLLRAQKTLHYLDSAATTQTPDVVIDAMRQYYEQKRGTVHRGTYPLSGIATQAYESVRDVVAELLNARDSEIIFTSGATQGLNMLAASLSSSLTSADNIVLTRMEHHANLVPWLQMQKQYGFEIRYIELTNDYEVDMASAKELIDVNTKIVSCAHVSNVLGTITPVAEITKLAHAVSALCIVDGAQAIAHEKIDLRALDCDAYVFSAHKMYGPTGTGVLYAKKSILDAMDPLLFGGDMIRHVSYDAAQWNDVPWKFEAGTPNISGVIGLGAAMLFLAHTQQEGSGTHETMLAQQARTTLASLAGVKIIGSMTAAAPIVSFTIDGTHPHDVATLLSSHNIAVRAGHHCAMPLMSHLQIPGTTRASFAVYNSQKDIDVLIRGVSDAQARLSKTYE